MPNVNHYDQIFKKIIESSSEGFWSIDAHTLTINEANNALCKLIGYERDEIVGRRSADFCDDKNKQILMAQAAKISSTQQRIYEVELRHKLGHNIPVLMNANTFRDEQGNILLGFAFVTDLTPQKTIQKKLETAKLNAEMASHAKSNFLAVMSHEIRTPLNGIIGILELLRSTELDKDQQALIHTADISADMLLNIISDILDFSKIEAQKLEIEVRPFALEKMLNTIDSLYSRLCDEHGIEFHMHVADDLPKSVLGDEHRIRQILYNYLNNALKFTQRGRIALQVAKPTSAAHQATVRFDVIDSGIGISAENQAKLFQEFSQADMSTTRQYGGTGLGLAICKRLGEMMQGTVAVSSETGKGSTFSLTVPLPEAELPQIAPKEADQSIKGIKVLVVEDNQINRMVAKSQLEKLGAIVSFAENGQLALEHADLNSAELILMDCLMPVMDGYSASQALRDVGYSRPIIALTANASKEDREHCLQCGMDDYLSKPYRSEKLLAALQYWRGRSHS